MGIHVDHHVAPAIENGVQRLLVAVAAGDQQHAQGVLILRVERDRDGQGDLAGGGPLDTAGK